MRPNPIDFLRLLASPPNGQAIPSNPLDMSPVIVDRWGGSHGEGPPPIDVGSMISGVPADQDPRWSMQGSDLYLWDRLAAGSPLRKGKESLYDLGLQGIGPTEYGQMRNQEEAAAVGSALAAKTEGMGDADFGALYQSLQHQMANRPPISEAPELRGPSTAQLVVGGLAALFAPQHAATALATPFQSALTQNAVEADRTRQRDADAYRRWTERIRATEGNISLLERRQGRQDSLNFRREDAARDDAARAAHQAEVLAAQNERAAISNATKAANSRETRIAQYLTAADDPYALPEGRVTNVDSAIKLMRDGDPEDPRLAGLINRRSAYARNGQAQNDRHNQSVATTAGVNARTKTENETRQGKVQRLLDAHDYHGARMEAAQADKELKEIRIKYLPAQMQASIDQANAAAEKARKDASDMAAGLRGRGAAAKADSWEKLGLKLEDSEAKARAKLAALTPQKDAIQRRLTQINRRLTATDNTAPDDKTKEALRKEAATLQQSFGKIGAVFAEQHHYLDSLKAQRAEVAAKIKSFQMVDPPMTIPGLPPNGPINGHVNVAANPPSGRTKSGNKYRVIP